MLKVGITGGIGSGKSTVSRVFESFGVPVYYTDPRAKQLMVEDSVIVDSLIALLGQEIYVNGELDRQFIASKIFTDRKLIEQVNSIVHPHVAADFERWAVSREGTNAPYLIMECAIMFESGFENLMQYTMTVSAPLKERVTRASLRDDIDVDHVRARMANQMSDEEREIRSDFTIHNSDHDMVLPRILELHEFFTDEGRR